ncbi:DUF397 domain-containing protein [Streptomyces sp. NPDC013172]|uniref:DUF397 domain-containing protein n=1 Tax=Streptomyces sp. NPDC013172 TaxID=3155009 RepID=UPI0033EAA236
MSDRLIWFKSSYSDSEGGNCLEVGLTWRERPHTVHVRDSKLGPRSPRVAVTGGSWAAFLAYARRDA